MFQYSGKVAGAILAKSTTYLHTSLMNMRTDREGLEIIWWRVMEHSVQKKA